MDPEQLKDASLRTDSVVQESKDSELSTSSPPSKGEIEGKCGEIGSAPSPGVKIKLAVRSPNKKETEEAGDIAFKMKEEGNQDENNNVASLAGRVEEESGSDEEEGSLRVKAECVEESNSHDTGPPTNQPVVASPKTGEVPHLQGRLSTRSIASALSPYCQVIAKPSWETSEAYHRARGPMLYLHLDETFYKVHRSLILTKIPRLPLIYFDLEDDDEDENFLNESLHNVNLMMYWLYHENLPSMVKIKRNRVFDGMTWDPIEFYMFAQKLSAFELMDCIKKVLPFPGQSTFFLW